MSEHIEKNGITYISTAEAADLTSYSQDYIGQLARSDKVPSTKVGRLRFVDRKALLEYAGKTSSSSSTAVAATESDSPAVKDSTVSSGDTQSTADPAPEFNSKRISSRWQLTRDGERKISPKDQQRVSALPAIAMSLAVAVISLAGFVNVGSFDQGQAQAENFSRETTAASVGVDRIGEMSLLAAAASDASQSFRRALDATRLLGESISKPLSRSVVSLLNITFRGFSGIGDFIVADPTSSRFFANAPNPGSSRGSESISAQGENQDSLSDSVATAGDPKEEESADSLATETSPANSASEQENLYYDSGQIAALESNDFALSEALQRLTVLTGRILRDGDSSDTQAVSGVSDQELDERFAQLRKLMYRNDESVQDSINYDEPDDDDLERDDLSDNSLDDLEDTSVGGVADGDLVQYDGSNWVNVSTSSLGITASGGTANTAGGQGAVQFNDGGNLGADTTNFFWDDVNDRLGIGTNAPVASIDVAGGTIANVADPTADQDAATKNYVDDAVVAGGGYNDEDAQDAVGTILTDTAELVFTYNDATPSITADLATSSIDESKLGTSVNDSLDLADSALQSGDNVSELTNDAGYITEADDDNTTYTAGNGLQLNAQEFSIAANVLQEADIDTEAEFEATLFSVVTPGENNDTADDLSDDPLSALANVAAAGAQAGEVLQWDGTSWVNAADSDTQRTNEEIEDVAGAMTTGNTETLIAVTYEDIDGTIDFVVNDDLSQYDNTTSQFTSQGDNISVFTNDAGYLTTVDISDDTNLAAGTGATLTGDTISVDLGTSISLGELDFDPIIETELDTETELEAQLTDATNIFTNNDGALDDDDLTDDQLSNLANVSASTAAAGEILGFDGTNWVAVTDEDTTYTAGNGLQLNAQEFSIAANVLQEADIDTEAEFEATLFSVVTPGENNDTADDLSDNTTDDLAEGTTNLYFTGERVDDRTNNLLTAGTDVSLTYNDAGNTLTISATNTDTQLTEDEVEANIFDADNTGTLSSGTLALNSLSYTGSLADAVLDDDLTISAGGSVADGALSANVSLLGQTIEIGELSFDPIEETELQTEGNLETQLGGLDVFTANDGALDDDDLSDDPLSALANVAAAGAQAGEVLQWDGTSWVNAADSDTQRTNEEIEDVAGAMTTGNTETLIAVTYEDIDGTIDFVVNDDLSQYDNTTSQFTSQGDNISVFTNDAGYLTTVDISDDTNLAAGTGATLTGDTISVDLGTSISLGELDFDPIIETELDTETELEAQLTDATNIFTNNDGALDDDDLTDDQLSNLANVSASTAAAGEILGFDGTNWVAVTDEDTTYTAGNGLQLNAQEFSIAANVLQEADIDTEAEFEATLFSVVTPGENNDTADDLSDNTTDDLAEGTTNLYFTGERVDDRTNNLLTAGTDVSLTYNDAGNTLTISATNTDTQLTEDEVEANIFDADNTGTLSSGTLALNSLSYTGSLADAVLDDDLTISAGGSVADGALSANVSLLGQTIEIGELSFDPIEETELQTEGNLETQLGGLDVFTANDGALDDDDLSDDPLSALANVAAAGAQAGEVLQWDGTSWVNAADSDTQRTNEEIEDVAGAMTTGNTETLIAVTYEDIDGTIDFVVNDDLSQYDNTTSQFTSQGDNISVFTNDAGYLTTVDISDDTNLAAGTGATLTGDTISVDLGTSISLGELDFDPIIETELDTETELEAQLTDATNIFTNNDGALDDDDLTDDQLSNLANVSASTAAAGEILGFDGTNWVAVTDEDTTYTAGNGLQLNAQEFSIAANVLQEADIDTEAEFEATLFSVVTPGENNDTADDLSDNTTDDLAEGTTNLYFTGERVDDRTNNLLTAGTDVSLTYNDAGNTLTISATNTDTQLTEDEVEANIFDADNTGTLSSGTLALNSLSYTGSLADAVLDDDLTISAGGSVADGALSANVSLLGQTIEIGELSFDPIEETELQTEGNLETQLGGLDVFTANDGALDDDDLSDNDTDDLAEGTTNLYSQWQESGADIFYTGGNVGIGNTAPASALDVTGTTTADAFAVSGDVITDFSGNQLAVTAGALGVLDGSGSGLDADQLDGLDSTQFLRSDVSDTFSDGTLTFAAGTTLNVNGSANFSDDVAITTDGQLVASADSEGTGINQGPVYINPTSAGINNVLLGLAVNGSERVRIDAEGDIQIAGLFNSTQTSGTNVLASSLAVDNDVTLGSSETDTVTFNGRVNTNIIPDTDDSYDLGAPSLRFSNIYAATTTIDNLVSGGTASSTFTINQGNNSADTEDSTLAFERGSETPNATLRWNATTKQFEFNDFPVSFADTINVAGTGQSTIAGRLELNGPPQGASITDSTLYVNPTSGATDNSLFAVAVNNNERFSVDAEGDVVARASLGIENELYDLTADTLVVDDSLQVNGEEIKDQGGITRFTLGDTNTITGNLQVSSLSNNRLVTTDSSGNLINSISSANMAASVTDESGTGNLVFSDSPTFTTEANFFGDTISDFTGDNLVLSGGVLSAIDTGEVNIGENLGTGAGVYAGKSSSTLEFKSLVAGTNVALSTSTTEVTISAADTQLTEDEVEANIFDADNTGTLSSGTLALNSLSYTGSLADAVLDDDLTISAGGSVADGALSANVSLLGQTIEIGELSFDPIEESELDTEAELESQLTDATNVFTNNDGALEDDDISDDNLSVLANVIAGSASDDDVLRFSGGFWVAGADQDTTYTAGNGLQLNAQEFSIAANVLQEADIDTEAEFEATLFSVVTPGENNDTADDLSDNTTDDLAEGTTNLYSQWLENGSSIYYNAGSVGIGTDTPQYKLDVNGEARFGNKSGTSGNVIVERGGGAAGFEINGSDGTIRGAAGNTFWQPYNYGNADNTFVVGHPSIGDFSWRFGAADGDPTSLPEYMRLLRSGELEIGTSTSVVINPNGSSYFNGGNVGIGETSPASLLDVDGTATVNSLAVGGDTITSFTGTNLTVSGGVLNATDTNTTYTAGNGLQLNAQEFSIAANVLQEADIDTEAEFEATLFSVVTPGENNDTADDLSDNTTDDLAEGTTNLYFTGERVDDRTNNLLTAGTDVSLTYNDAGNTLTISATNTDTQLTEDEVEANIFDADNTGTLSSGTLALNSLSYTGSLADAVLDDDLTISAGGSVADGALSANVSLLGQTIEIGELSFDPIEETELQTEGNLETQLGGLDVFTANDGALDDDDLSDDPLSALANVAAAGAQAGEVLQWDGTSWVNAADSDTQRTNEEIEDVAGAMTTGNTETLIAVTYEDIDGTIDFVVNDDLSQYDNTTSQFTSQGDNISVFTNDAGYLTTVDISDDTNLAAGTGATLTGDTISVDLGTSISLGELDFDPIIETELDTETELEAQLTDATNIFTNNDGALDDDDLTDDQLSNLANVSASTAAAGEILGFDGTNWVAVTDEDTTYTAGNGLQLNAQEFSIAANVLQEADIDTEAEFEATLFSVVTPGENNDTADDLSDNTTDDLAEGTTNLYFTGERVDDRTNNLLTAGTDVSLTYNDAGNTLTISATNTDTQLTEDEVEANIFDADNTGTLSSGTLALNSLSYTGSLADAVLDDDLTISAGGSVADGALSANVSLLGQTIEIGELSFDPIEETELQTEGNLETQLGGLDVFTANDGALDDDDLSDDPLSALANVAAAGAGSGQVLEFDGSNWIAGTDDVGESASTSGAVQFADGSGGFSADASNFFWDDTNNRLGIGANTPGARLTVEGSDEDLLEVLGAGGQTLASFSDADSATSTGNFTVYDNGFQGPLNAVFAAHADDDAIYLSKFYNDTYSTTDPVFTYFAWNDGRFVQSTETDAPLQFSTNGFQNVRMTIAGDGNVGIGTTTPGSLLEVDGDSEINGALTVDGINLTPATQGSIPFIFNGAGAVGEDNANLFYDAANSRLGIGTNSPADTLDVNGNILADGLNASGGIVVSSAFSTGADSITSFQGTNLSVSGGVLNAAGGPGIWDLTNNIVSNTGTNSAEATDDFVFGSSQLNDDGNADHDSRFFFDKSKGAFRAGVDGFGVWDSGFVGNQSVAFGNGTEASGDQSAAFGENTIALGRQSVVFGNATEASGISSAAFGNATDATGNSAVSFGFSTEAAGSYSAAFGQDITAAGENSFAVALDGNQAGVSVPANTASFIGGNVGIGTENPAEVLDIVGNIKGSGNLQIGGDTITDFTGTNLSVSGGVLNAAGGGATTSPAGTDGAIQFNNSGSFGADTSNFFWDDTNNRLGIGTSTPEAGYQLTLENDASQDSIFLRNLANSSRSSSITQSTLGYLEIDSTAITEYKIGGSRVARFSSAGLVNNEDGNSGVNFRAESNNNTHALFVDSANDAVGIGTANPATTLDVAGTSTAQAFSVGGDTITDFTGTNLSVSGGVLNAAGGASSAGTAEAIQYSNGSGGFSADANNFFYDVSASQVVVPELSVDYIYSLVGGIFNDIEIGAEAGYITFGTSGSGSFGYGLRDNAGDIEYKDSGGAWTAFNTLGGGGATTFTGLSDTPASYTTSAIPYTNAAGNALLFASDFIFDGASLGIGTGNPSASLEIAANGTTPRFRVESATSGVYALEVDENDAATVGTGAGDIFLDTTGGTQVGIGTQSPGNTLDVVGTIRQSSATNCELAANIDGDLICSGTSDETLKTDIEALNASSSLTKLNQLAGKTFRYRPEARLGTAPQIGFIAQEVEQIFPELVGQNNGTKYVNYDKLTAVLAEAVQEVDRKVEDLSLSKQMLATNTAAVAAAVDEDSVVSRVVDKLTGFVSDSGQRIAGFFDQLFAREIVVAREEGEDNQSAGEGEILAGTASTTVENTLVDENARVMVTFTGPLDGRSFHVEKEEGEFTVVLSESLEEVGQETEEEDSAVSFDYLIIGVTDVESAAASVENSQSDASEDTENGSGNESASDGGRDSLEPREEGGEDENNEEDQQNDTEETATTTDNTDQESPEAGTSTPNQSSGEDTAEQENESGNEETATSSTENSTSTQAVDGEDDAGEDSVANEVEDTDSSAGEDQAVDPVDGDQPEEGTLATSTNSTQ